MKIKVDALVEAIGKIIESGNEQVFKELSREKRYFIIANSELVEIAKLHMVKRPADEDISAESAIRSNECDDCRFID